MEEIVEWRMVEDLYKIHDELTQEAEDFIMKLHENLDPHTPFREQVIGLPASVEKQEKWLFSLYEKHVNFDDEAAREYWDEN